MLDAIFQSSAQQVLAKYKTEITKINDLETTFCSLSDLKLKEKVTELKQRFLNDENDEFLDLQTFLSKTSKSNGLRVPVSPGPNLV